MLKKALILTAILALALSYGLVNAGPNAGGGSGSNAPAQKCQWVTTTVPKLIGWTKHGFPIITMETTQIYVCRPA
jgi:hypothetical protein